MSKRVVVATDGSKAAERAVDFALTMAKMWEAELIAVTVSTNLSPTELRQLAMARKDRDLDAATEELVANILGDVESRAARHGVANVRCVSMSGDPANVALKVAREADADLLVVGRRGLGGLSRLLLGSVSEKIVARAHCTVTAVP